MQYKETSVRVKKGRSTIPIQRPLFMSLTLLSKSSYESTVNTLSGAEAILSSSEETTSSPIPKENTGAPLLWSLEEATSRGMCTPWSVAFFPVVITSTGYRVTTEQNSTINWSEFYFFIKFNLITKFT